MAKWKSKKILKRFINHINYTKYLNGTQLHNDFSHNKHTQADIARFTTENKKFKYVPKL